LEREAAGLDDPREVLTDEDLIRAGSSPTKT
jgi:hypothetical protein